DPAELEQELDVVRAPPADARLAPRERSRLRFRQREPLLGRRRVALPQRGKPEDGEVLGRMERELLPGELECTRGGLACEPEPPAVKRDGRDRKVVLRHLEPVLDRDVVRSRCVVGRELPAAAPELDPREAPERPCATRLVALAPLGMLALEQGQGLVAPVRAGKRADDRERRLLDELRASNGRREVVWP